MPLTVRFESALQSELHELASSALGTPNNRDLFEYGRICGEYQGLQRALEIFTEQVRDQAVRDGKL